MNVFYLDRDVRACAQAHNDKHCVKMILEYCQLLCTAHHELTPQHTQKEPLLYKPTHRNHPSALWARHTTQNYEWLASLLLALCQEYTYRYDRVHKCESSGLVQYLANTLPPLLPSGQFSQPTQAMPEEYKSTCSQAAYRAYYLGAKPHLATWRRRPAPEWWG